VNQPPRIITIVCRAGNDFDVHEGERFADRLCWDEMLGQVATMTLSREGPLYPMQTSEEREARRDRMRERCSGIEVVS
jgi:hypothetical protein